MTAHPPTPPPPLGSNTEKERPPTPLIAEALSIWRKHRRHTYSPLYGFCGIFILQKNSSARSEEHKRPCEIPFVAVSSDMLERWQMLPTAPLERFRRKFLKMCQGKQNLPHSSSFRWSRQVPEGNLPRCGGKKWTEEKEINMQNLNINSSQRMVAHLEDTTDRGQFMFWI